MQLTRCPSFLPSSPRLPLPPHKQIRRKGESFDRARHECGTEVKAITYSAMQIHEHEGKAEVFVIVDI